MIEVIAWSEDNDVNKPGQVSGLILKTVSYDASDQFISDVADIMIGFGSSEADAITIVTVGQAFHTAYDVEKSVELVTSYKPSSKAGTWAFPESALAESRIVGTRMRLVLGHNQALEGYLVIRDLGDE